MWKCCTLNLQVEEFKTTSLFPIGFHETMEGEPGTQGPGGAEAKFGTFEN